MIGRSPTVQALRACLTTGLATAGCLLLLAAPALAASVGEREGEEPGEPLGAAATIGLFVLLPALILLVIGGLAWLPALREGSRYRPQRGWDAPPVWFAGPADPAGALSAAGAGADNRGGAHGSW